MHRSCMYCRLHETLQPQGYIPSPYHEVSPIVCFNSSPEALGIVIITTSRNSQGASPSRHHGGPPVLVNAGEALALGGQLLIDVFRVEDRLQIQPITLDGKPLVDELANHLTQAAEYRTQSEWHTTSIRACETFSQSATSEDISRR